MKNYVHIINVRDMKLDEKNWKRNKTSFHLILLNKIFKDMVFFANQNSKNLWETKKTYLKGQDFDLGCF